MRGRPRIAVLGSVHMDLIASTDRLPAAGESVAGTGFTMAPGGKGGNQAAQCAALGAEAFMLAQLGDDAFGRTLLAALQARSIDVSQVRITADHATGASTVFASQGDYCSIIVPGAAAALTAAEVEASLAALAPLDALLLQLELPIALNIAAAKAAKAQGARVVLNASPAIALPAEFLRNIDVLVVNRVEAARILGRDGPSEEAARTLAIPGPAIAVVTLGAEGAVAADANSVVRQMAFPVAVADAVGAGDAFLGTLAVTLLQAKGLAEALRRGCAAGAIAASRQGSAAVNEQDITAFLEGR